MIIGIGVDVLDVPRFIKVYQRFGRSFLQRICSPAEQAYIAQATPQRQQAFCAGRFALKEAMVKALGTGMANGLSWHHFSIVPNELGAPQAICHDLAHQLCMQRSAGQQYQWHVSLSDTASSVTAFVVIQKI